MVTEIEERIHNGDKITLLNVYKTDDPEERKVKFNNIMAENFCRTMSNEFVKYVIKDED